jgi:hypothetical protein
MMESLFLFCLFEPRNLELVPVERQQLDRLLAVSALFEPLRLCSTAGVALVHQQGNVSIEA